MALLTPILISSQSIKEEFRNWEVGVGGWQESGFLKPRCGVLLPIPTPEKGGGMHALLLVQTREGSTNTAAPKS